MLSLGIIGEYLARIYEEVKRCPRYLISRTAESPADGRAGFAELRPEVSKLGRTSDVYK